MLAAVDNLSHEPYTKSLSLGRGAEQLLYRSENIKILGNECLEP